MKLTNMLLILRNISFTLVLPMTLMACSEDDVVNQVPVTLDTSSYLFFTTDDVNTANLQAVDPLAATPAEINVDSGVHFQNVSRLMTGTYEGDGTVTDRHLHAVIYPKAGSIYKVNGMPEVGDATSVQVSSEASLEVSSGTVGIDYANPDNSQYVYQSFDGTTLTWMMVRLGMASTDVPIPAVAPIQALHNPTTGALTGWIVDNGTSLQETDANFANPVTAVTSLGFGVIYSIEAPDGGFWVATNGSPGTLLHYDPATNTETLVTTFNDTFNNLMLSDGVHLYFRNNNAITATNHDIIRVNLLTKVVETVGTYVPTGATETFEEMVLTDNAVVFAVKDTSVIDAEYTNLKAYTKGASQTLRTIYSSALGTFGTQKVLASGSYAYIDHGGDSFYAHESNGTSAAVGTGEYLLVMYPAESNFSATSRPSRLLLSSSLAVWNAATASKVGQWSNAGFANTGSNSFNIMAEPTNGRTLLYANTLDIDAVTTASIYDIFLTPKTDASGSMTRVGTNTVSTATPKFIGPPGCSLGEGSDITLMMLLIGALAYQFRRRYHRQG